MIEQQTVRMIRFDHVVTNEMKPEANCHWCNVIIDTLCSTVVCGSIRWGV